MLAEWERQQPGRSENIFRALGNVSPSQLADRSLFDFAVAAPRIGPLPGQMLKPAVMRVSLIRTP